jgi:hypothetical protein
MTNPISFSKLWVTPADEQDLYRRLDNTGTPQERAIAWNAAMMALNLAHQLHERSLADVA